MKQAIPWPVKFAVKLILGATRVDYRVLKRMRLVEHGRMEEADFARQIFELHVNGPCRELGRSPQGTLLEIGPGDSVATGVLGRAAGFDVVELVDAGHFADLTSASLHRLFASLGAAPPRLTPGAGRSETLSELRSHGIQYEAQGLESLRALESDSVSHSFSNTVLQHVYRDQLPELIAQLGRAHKPGGFGSHSVNFTDHFSGGFVNHRLPAWVMESSLVKRGNLYTNRVGTERYIELFVAARLIPCRLIVDFFDSDGPAHAVYDSPEQFLSEAGSRRILRTIFWVQKS